MLGMKSDFWLCGLYKAFKLKIIYSEKATQFCEISTLLLSYVVPVKSKVEISQNFVAFSEYMNFNDFVFFERIHIFCQICIPQTWNSISQGSAIGKRNVPQPVFVIPLKWFVLDKVP